MLQNKHIRLSISIQNKMQSTHLSICSPLKSLCLHRKKMFDVSAASENALQVDPTSLHVYPDIKQSHDAVKLIFPA